MAKNLVSVPILVHLAQIFFSEIWLRQSLDIMISYHHVQYQKKTNDPILRKFSDGRTDGRTGRQTERQTGENDIIGRCPTNVERPKMY